MTLFGRIARAFASDKQAHLDFYQRDLNFSEAHSYRLRRNELKTINPHASTPLSVHASELAVKEAFETEVKYWAAIAPEIHPRIASRQWTPEQKHYAYWLLNDEHRFSLLILDRAPINEKISLAVGERKQVQNYLRRRARRIMQARPSVALIWDPRSLPLAVLTSIMEPTRLPARMPIRIKFHTLHKGDHNGQTNVPLLRRRPAYGARPDVGG